MNKNNIKPQQLRIGNWVALSGTMPMSIYEIHEDCFYAKDTKGSSFKNTWADVQPIPLSEEVLLRCPTLKKKTGKYGDYFYDSYYELLRIWFHEKWFIGKKVDGVKYNTLIISENIQHLHELQNIFPLLTQTELEVSL